MSSSVLKLKRSDAADGKSDAESEGHSLPLNQRLMMALCTTMTTPSRRRRSTPGEELPTGMGCGYDRGAHEDEQAEQKAGSAGAQLS